MFDPDITWHVGGRSALAGDYHGTDAVLGYFVALFERSGGTFAAELLECGEMAPDLVCALVRITGDLPGGRLDTTIVQTFRERDGYAQDAYAMDEAIGGVITLPDARRPEPAATPIGT